MTALILGANGQDGTLLAQNLVARGVVVVGIGRQSSPRDAWPATATYQQLDLRDVERFAQLLDDLRPASIFHFAAVHGSAAKNAYEERFDLMLDVNVRSVHVVLEHCRLRQPEARLLYASSLKAFGAPPPSTISEETPRRSTCLYGLTKNAATDLIHHYRKTHGIRASVVYLFNHESPLRDRSFFIPKLAAALHHADHADGISTPFFSLDFMCDWGSAEEYVDLAGDLLDMAPGEDVVMATGRCVNARDLANRLFSRRGCAISDYIEEEHLPSRPPTPYFADLSKLNRLVGRTPQRTIEQVVEEMVDALSP